MSMKDLLSKMTELQGTDTNEEVVSSNGKKVLTESAERPYVCVHAKKGKCEVKANSSYEAAKKAADKWKLKSTAGIDAYVADKPISTASLGENTKPSLKNIFNTMLSESNSEITEGVLDSIKHGVRGAVNKISDKMHEKDDKFLYITVQPTNEKEVKLNNNLYSLHEVMKVFHSVVGNKDNVLTKKGIEVGYGYESSLRAPKNGALYAVSIEEASAPYEKIAVIRIRSTKPVTDTLVAEDDQITIQPAKQNTQVIKQGQKTLGTVENPQLAAQIKQSIGKGEMTLAGDELNEKWGEETKVAPSEKGKYEGKTKAELLKQYNALKASGPHKEGSSEYGKMRELAFAIRAKSGWNKVDESKLNEDSRKKQRGDYAVVGIEAYGVRGMNSKPWRKTFKSQEAFEKWLDATDGDVEVQGTREVNLNDMFKEDVSESKLNEKAVSKSQQQAAGAALAAKRGDTPKNKLKGASKEMAKMSTKELEKFATTKHKGLPEKKQKTDEALEKDGPKSGDLNFKVPTGEKGKEYTANKAKQRADMNKKNDPGAAKKGLALSVVDREKAANKAKKKTNEAAMPTHDGDFGAGLGAGRSNTTLEERSSRRLIDSDEKGNRAYKIYVDRDWQEYVVKFYENGKYLPDADYHADEEQEAMDTGYHFLNNLTEGKKAKPDYIDLDKDGNKKESMKKAAADKQKVSTMKKTTESKAKPDYIDLDKDGNKKESMKKAAADAKKKKVAVKEGANPTEAARLLGKAHALAKDPFACKYESGTPEAQSYLAGYKEGLDECYGSGSMGDSGMGDMDGAAIMPGMDSMVSQDSMMDSPSPRGGSDFEFGGFDDVSDDDMMAFESWDRELNALLNEGKMKDIDLDMKELSDAQFKKDHGMTKNQMKKSLSNDTAKTDKKTVKEGISVSVSKGNQGTPDSVTVTAQDNEADALLAMIKQAGLGLFGGEETSGYGAPTTPQMPTSGSDVGDHDSMMALIKKMTTGSQDYEDEESQDDDHVHGHPDAACDACGSSDCECDSSDSKALVVGEEETEDQEEFEVAEANAPDSDEAETAADENAEAEEDKALAGADSDKEEEIDEGSCSMDEEEELNEWANDAGYEGSENTKDNTFEQDIEFMTRVISGGLNGQKQDQTTLPHTKVKVEENDSISDWKKLSGIK